MKFRRIRDNLVLILEDCMESQIIDEIFGSNVDDTGLIAKGEYQIRLSTDCHDHYILLKPEKK